MDFFDVAVEHTFGKEGGFTGEKGLPNDHGGAGATRISGLASYGIC